MTYLIAILLVLVFLALVAIAGHLFTMNKHLDRIAKAQERTLYTMQASPPTAGPIQ
jgi:hypothetical protein